MRKSIDENVDICSDVTAYACISHERNGQLASKTHYVTEGKLFFQKVAEGKLFFNLKLLTKLFKSYKEKLLKKKKYFKNVLLFAIC